MFVAAACGSTGTATPTTGAATTAPATSTGPTASPVPSASGINIVDTKYATQTTPAAKTGGTVVVSDWEAAEVDAVNPYYADSEIDIEMFSSPSFDGMLTVTQNLAYTGDLASEVPTVANGDVVVSGTSMAITWKMKPNMEWSDGKPINCDDLIATWHWIMDPGQTALVAGTSGWDQITSIDGAGTSTCVVHFKSLYEGYLTLFSPILPAHYITTVAVKDATTSLYPLADPVKGVYSGPYIPQAFVPDAQATLVANPHWATIGIGSNLHAPYLDKVIFKLYANDPALMIAGFKNGEIDLGMDLQNADIPNLNGIPTAQVLIHDALTYEMNTYNNESFQKKFGTDATTVIQAVKLATDRQAIAAGPLQGNVTVVNNNISPLTWYYKDEGGDTTAHPDQAATMLASAGFTKDSTGILAKNGKEIELQYCTTMNQVRLSTLQLIASQLAAIGIKVDVTGSSKFFSGWASVPNNQPCNLAHGNFDVGEFAFSSPLDPLSGYFVYDSMFNPDPAPHNGQNYARINLPALDAAWTTLVNNVDLQKIKDAMTTIQDIYVSSQNTFELPLFLRKDVNLTDGKIQNVVGNPTSSSVMWNAGDWWLQQ